MLRPLRAVLATSATLTLLLVAAPPAWSTAPEAPAASETPELLVVLDSSGSMAEADAGGGQTRMEAAKQAVTELAGSTPETTRIGLRTYGDGVDSEAPGSCEDTTLRVPVGPVDRDALVAQVQQLEPRGDTPIGNALLAAAGDFTGAGPQSVVLVSDGEPTCEPDPCPVAAQLAEQGIDLRVDVIGFRVDDEARAVLQCIADSGGGSYVDAADAGALAQALDTAAERVYRVYETEGVPVEGTATPAGAPVLEPGLYLDTFAPDETRHYVVDVPAGATAHLALTAVREGGEASIQPGGAIKLRTSTEDASCSSSYDVGGTSGVEGPVTGSVDHGPFVRQNIGERDPACDDGGRVLLTAEWSDTDDSPPTPVELLVSIEDPLADPSEPGDRVASETEVPAPAPAGEISGAVAGGGSFATATPVGPGGYEDTVRPGETLFYSVDVDWGQQLGARVDYPGFEQGTAERDALGSGPVGPWTSVELFGPLRAPVVAPSSDFEVLQTNFVRPGTTTAVGSATVPVLFANRTEALRPTIAAASLAGKHYVAVTMGRSDGQAPDAVGVAIPFVLSISVTGEPVDGPEYAAASAPEPSEPAATASESPSADEAVASPVAEPSEAALASSPGRPAALVPVLVAAAVLLALALGALVAYGVAASRRRSDAGRP